MSRRLQFALVLSLPVLLALAGLRPMQVPPAHSQHLVSRFTTPGSAVFFADAPDSVVPVSILAVFGLGAIGLLTTNPRSAPAARLEQFSCYIRPPPSY